jgi:hypothetical protein
MYIRDLIGLEVNSEKPKYIEVRVQQNENINTLYVRNKFFENVVKFTKK